MNYKADSKEPGGICWFCNRRRAEPRARLTAILYYPGVEARQAVIARCVTCKRIHAMQNYSAYFLIAVILIVSIVLTVVLGDGDFRASIIVFFVGALLLSFLVFRLQLMLERAMGVRNLRNVSEHDEVIEIMKETGLQYIKYRN